MPMERLKSLIARSLLVSADRFAQLNAYCDKATTDERIDEAMRHVLGDDWRTHVANLNPRAE
jgi:hypothetical protein